MSNHKTVEARRSQAQERNAEFGKLSPQQQIALLDLRLGTGVGAVKQRAKLAAILSAPAKAAAAPKGPKVEKVKGEATEKPYRRQRA